MSGSKEKTNRRTSTTQTLDPWSRDQWQTQSDAIRENITDYRQGITGYTGNLSAGMTDFDRQAGGLAQQSVGSWQGGLDETRGLLDAGNFTQMQPRTFADFDADTYVNPHSDDMIARNSADMQEVADQQRAQATASTLSNGAYGGSRHGVREAALDASLIDAVGDMSARTRFDTWNAGADRFYQDVGNEMSAANYNNNVNFQRAQGMAGLLDAQRGYEQQDIDRMNTQGDRERAILDNQYSREYADYLRQRQEQQAAMGLDFGLLGATPMLINSTGTESSVTKSNPGALGIAGTLLGGASTMFGGGGMFATGGLFGKTG